MKPNEAIKTHFALLRRSSHDAFADYHANVLYGYLSAMRDNEIISSALHNRLQHIVSKAWSLKYDRIHGIRRAA